MNTFQLIVFQITFTKDLATEVSFDAVEFNIMQLCKIHFMSAKNASVDPYLKYKNIEIIRDYT